MLKIKIKQVDAFTNVPLTGNPAGVVLEGKYLVDKQMQLIAQEMNVSETAFILPPSREEADLKIRWFTPNTEVSLCGHATVAAFHSLAEEGKMGLAKDGNYHFKLETASGILPVDVLKVNGKARIMLGLNIPTFERVTYLKLDLVRVLNISLSDFESKASLYRSDYLFVPIRRLHTLFSMKPNFLMMAKFLTNYRLQGICVFTTETVDQESSFHSRFFAPHVGINEDPVTGSAHAPLAVLLFNSGYLSAKEGKYVFQGEQGDVIGRKGRVAIELEVENDIPKAVKIGGTAVTVLEGEILIQD